MAGKRTYSNLGKRQSFFHSARDWVITRSANARTRISQWNGKNKLKTLVQRLFNRIERRPFSTFFIFLALLFLFIIVGSRLRQPKPQKSVPPAVKAVEVYHIGTAPKVHVEAQVEKTGLVKITALTGGVITKISVSEGQQVAQGAPLISLSTNYSGGNTASLGRELAATQYNNVKDTYDTQKDIIQKQRTIANQNKTNTDKLRDITNQSVTDTQNLVNLNNDILSTLNTNLQNLQNNNPNGANNALILATKQQISQFQATINQLNSGLRQSQYQNDTNNPPQQLANIQHDLTMQQLDAQQKALDLSLASSRIQLSIAQVNESTMFPSAPFAGVIERIYVTAGQNVTPGTPLLELHGAQDLKLVAKVPSYIAQNVSQIEDSVIHVPQGNTIPVTPEYISTESTDGALYSVIYSLPQEYQNAVSDKEYIAIDIPVGYANTTSVEPFVPLDTVYQSESNAYVFTNDHGTARSKVVTLGSIYGQYVEVISGLSNGDAVIVSRTVLNGDKVRAE